MFRTFALIVVAALFMSAAVAWAQDQDGGEPVQPPAGLSQSQTQVPREVVEFLQDRRPASELSDDQLGQRARQARQLLRMEGLSPQLRREIKAIAEQLRAERQT